MTTSPQRLINVTIVATDPPFNSGDGVLLGLQSKREVDDPVPATETAQFDTMIEVRASDSGMDFFGDHVHGRRGDRFLYLSWGMPAQAEPFVMFARAKIKLSGIPNHLLDRCVAHGGSLVADVQMTNAKGQPASGTITPPAVHWRPGD